METSGASTVMAKGRIGGQVQVRIRDHFTADAGVKPSLTQPSTKSADLAQKY